MNLARIPHRCDSPLHTTWCEASERPGCSRYTVSKSLLDKTLALAILVVTSPVMLLAMLLVRLTSAGPVIYAQSRVGLDGAVFRMFKIRSMIHDCEKRSGPQWSGPGDPRVTLVGRFLRKSHVDELPQLINVLRGEMSLVGPRPERPPFVAQLQKALPHYRERLAVPPGITGLAQIQLGPDTELSSVAAKLICDLHYIQNLSVGLDLSIMLVTPLRLVGVPFPALRWLLGLPAVRDLECTCAERPSGFAAIPVAVQPAALELGRDPVHPLIPSPASGAAAVR
ncbi:MAG: sugar transferase [Isosphaeraceae bacterium]